MGVTSSNTPDQQKDGTGAECDAETHRATVLSYSAFSKLTSEQLPLALALGMSAAEYWDEDISLFWAYARAGKIKRKQEDYAAWAQGFYIDLALTDVLSQMFAPKGRKVKRIYPEKPIFTDVDEQHDSTPAPKINASEAATAAAAAAIRERFRALNDATNAALRESE